MSVMSNIVVFDGAATPVSHTCVPISVQREGKRLKALWREMLPTLPTEAQVSIEASQEILSSGVIKSVVRVNVPVMETVSGQNAAGYTAAPKVAYVDSDEYVKYAHPRSTVTGRRLSRGLLVNVVNNVTSSVAMSAAGAVPELADLQVMPS